MRREKKLKSLDAEELGKYPLQVAKLLLEIFFHLGKTRLQREGD